MLDAPDVRVYLQSFELVKDASAEELAAFYPPEEESKALTAPYIRLTGTMVNRNAEKRYSLFDQFLSCAVFNPEEPGNPIELTQLTLDPETHLRSFEAHCLANPKETDDFETILFLPDYDDNGFSLRDIMDSYEKKGYDAPGVKLAFVACREGSHGGILESDSVVYTSDVYEVRALDDGTFECDSLGAFGFPGRQALVDKLESDGYLYFPAMDDYQFSVSRKGR